jgi:hypothetical protein
MPPLYVLSSEKEAMEKSANLSPTRRQKEMKTRHGLSDLQFRQMLEMLAGLTPAERATLKDPEFITEDEADLIVIDREPDGPTVSAEKIFAEYGYTPRSRRA